MTTSVMQMQGLYLRYARKIVRMSGPPTSQLVRERKIRSPYPKIFNDSNFPLESNGPDMLFVLVPLEVDPIGPLFENLRLLPPTPEQAIRFISQSDDGGRYAVHREQTVIFPCEPRFIDPGITIGGNPGESHWLALAWRDGFSETILIHSEDNLANLHREKKISSDEFAVQWPQNALIAGVAIL
jgi:hypothetical protein